MNRPVPQSPEPPTCGAKSGPAHQALGIREEEARASSNEETSMTMITVGMA